MLKNKYKIIGLFALFLTIGCAKRGTISGGLKDTLAPKLKYSLPKNFSTNFKGNEVKLFFNEYVKLKDVSKQLVVSPPMDKPVDLSPQVASNYISIKIKDTLKPNTTYSFNFGDGIEDNNEGNKMSQFKYVFSTGNEIDTLSISGTIKDALEKKPDNFVTIMLYEMNEKYTDSIIYKQKPRYVTNTLDSLKIWKIENIKAGKYLLVAVKDVGNNFKFDPKSDKIGFYKEIISVPTNTFFELKIFKEQQEFQVKKVQLAAGNRALIAYEGKPKKPTVVLKNNGVELKTVLTQFPKKDSLQVWYNKIKADSLTMTVSDGKYSKDFTYKIKDAKKDTLSVSGFPQGLIHFREDFEISTSTPIVSFDKSKMVLLNKDSVAVKFEVVEDVFNQKLKVVFKKEPLEKYKMKLAAGAMTDFFGQKSPDLVYKFETKNTTDYGNLFLKLENVKKYPLIVELTSDKGDVLARAFAEKEPNLNIELIEPANFYIRIIYDENGNKEWDSGNFLKKIQPEEVIYFMEPIGVRANWDWVQPLDLLDSK
jgi:uncharacterized protein (DUF2141 family)